MIGFIERLLLGPIKAKTCLHKRTLEPLQAVLVDAVAKNTFKLYKGNNMPRTRKLEYEIAKIAGGMDHYMILSKCGKLYTFGSNEHGQLGTDICKNTTLWSSLRVDDDTEEIYEEPQLLSTMDGEEPSQIVDIAAGHFTSFAVTTDRKLYAWGAGILGVGDEYFDTRPQRVPLKNVVSVQAWRDLVLAKTTSNEKYIFGAALEGGKKMLKPVLCSVDDLPGQTEEYPDMPIHYFSHHTTTDPSSFTIPPRTTPQSNGHLHTTCRAYTVEIISIQVDHNLKMATLPEMRIKSAKYAKNITKRGKVGPLTSRRQSKYAAGPIIIAVLLFVLVGSGVIQLLRGQFF